jgi:hypothetical protein
LVIQLADNFPSHYSPWFTFATNRLLFQSFYKLNDPNLDLEAEILTAMENCIICLRQVPSIRLINETLASTSTSLPFQIAQGLQMCDNPNGTVGNDTILLFE